MASSAGDGDVSEARVCLAHGFQDWTAQVVEVIGVRRRRKIVGDLNLGPFSPFGLMSGGNGDVGLALDGQRVDRSDDGLWAVGLDEFHERLQVPTGRIVLRVVLQLAPRGEEDQLGVRGTSPLLELLGGQSQCDERLSTSGQGDATTAAIAVYRYLAALRSGHPDPVGAILGDIGRPSPQAPEGKASRGGAERYGQTNDAPVLADR